MDWTVKDIHLVICLFQNKVYPRERDYLDIKYRGRIRMQLKNDDGTPKMEEFPDRKLGISDKGEGLNDTIVLPNPFCK